MDKLLDVRQLVVEIGETRPGLLPLPVILVTLVLLLDPCLHHLKHDNVLDNHKIIKSLNLSFSSVQRDKSWLVTNLEIFSASRSLPQLGLEVSEPLAHFIQLVVELEVLAVVFVELSLVLLPLLRARDHCVSPGTTIELNIRILNGCDKIFKC